MIAEDSIIATIDRTRELIRQETDDSVFSDRLIYSVLLDNRNVILYRELNKRKFRSKFIFKTVCLPLETTTDIPCDCIPKYLGCIALKGKFPLPKPLSNMYGDLMNILSLDGSRQYTFKEVRVGRYNIYTRVNEDGVKPYFTIYNDILYVIDHPTNLLPAVLVEMIPENPTEFDEITLCTDDGEPTTETCFDPAQDTFNVDGHLLGAIIKMAKEELVGTLQLPDDVRNDAISVPEQLRV